MRFLNTIFTWWNGATIGTILYSWRKGIAVGQDSLGNRYFHSRDKKRRWVLYSGSNDASRVPSEWHSWLHATVDELPNSSASAHRKSNTKPNAEPQANLTGTAAAYRPAGAIERGGKRQAATGDYEAWQPD